MFEKLASNKLFDGQQLQYQHHSQVLACTMRFFGLLAAASTAGPSAGDLLVVRINL